MQANTNGNLLEIIDLANSLRQEHLFIANEQNAFNNLNDTLKRNSSNVAQIAWICAQQRRNLNRLIASRPESGPSFCCRKSSALENTNFVDAYKAHGIKYQHVLAYNELFNFLHRSPYLLAQSLTIGDNIKEITNNEMLSVIHTISTGLYGNAILSKDVDMVLRLLRDLIEIQIVVSDNPRRILRTGSCAFSRLYHRLHETMFSSKVFLTAALYEPIMKVLISDEAMLNIDTAKAVQNLSQSERLKRFGTEGTPEYEEKVQQFHKDTLTSLHNTAMLFIRSLLDNWTLFPSTLRWVLQTMCHLLKSVHIHESVVNDILVDMVFTNFICIAVVSPDLIGISDASISENARYNLIQIGQILQMLALNRHEGTIDQKYEDLFAYFPANIVSELTEQLLESDYDISMTTMAIPQQNDFGREHVLVTQNELNIFVDFLRTVLDYDQLAISGDDRRKLSKILEQLPDKFELILSGDQQNIQQLVPEHPNKAKQLMNLGKSTKNKLAKSISLNVNAQPSADADESGLSNNFHRFLHIHGNGANGSGSANSSPTHNASHTGNGAVGGINQGNNINKNNTSVTIDEQVLLIPITIYDDNKFKILTEQEVLNMNNISNARDKPLAEQNIDQLDKVNDDDFDEMGSGLPSRKHARFSLSQDDQSIGNTSDNLEVVSEAPSNHSVTSSLELEENDQNLNDNLSDMVSANVSGRGTPNISGRDTPSSQVTEGDNVIVPTPQMANKARSDINDKFCKFEIKKLVEGDETISIISDTWSTDVLASDSETIEANENERNFSTPLIPSAVCLPGDNNFNPIGSGVSHLNANFLDASDARSESAWSTDVLASDSEKMTEVDTDDNQSITAKSDITDAGRPENDSIPDVIPSINQRTVNDSPFGPLQSPNLSFRTPDSPVFNPRASDLRNSKNRPFDDSAGVTGEGSLRFPNDDLIKLSPSPNSSARNSNRYSDALLFRNNRSYQVGNSFERDPFLATPSTTVKRQNSAESSISNQSSSLDEPPPLRLTSKFHKSNANKAENGFYGSANKDNGLIQKSSMDLKNPFNDELVTDAVDEFDGDEVKHRPSSSEQRNVSFDGRRNGMVVNAASSTMTKRLASSLTYENHEIIINKTNSLQLITPLEATATDDDKHQHRDEYSMLLKTLSLSLKTENGTDENATLGEPPIAPAPTTPKHAAKYTGTIPKSISFDSSAEKTGDRGFLRSEVGHSYPNYNSYGGNGQRQNGSGFFNQMRKFINPQGFKNRRSHKLLRGAQDDYQTAEAPIRVRSGSGEGMFGKPPLQSGLFTDATDDILAKYRRKISSSSEATNSADSLGNSSGDRKSSSNIEEDRVSLMTIDKKINLYSNAKHKLRLVLSTTDLHTADFRHPNCQNTTPILTYLQIQLAQAVFLQNLQQISFISETIRCVKLLDDNQMQTLLADLQTDLIQRQSYLQYLMCCRQRLLSALEGVDRLEDRLRNEREMCNRHLIMVCIRMFLEKREDVVQQFQVEFSVLTVVDEKLDCMNEFMAKLMDELRLDIIFYGMAEWQLDEARACIERILMQRLYRQVMFPNTDADMDRDQVLHDHIRKLARIITPSHSALRIPEEYLSEAPWPFAQQQISYISVYKTPREKVICIVRCITSIMTLIRMSSNRVGSADDLIPILIYVVIKANPPYLLSTMQYVNAFYGDLITGEDHYWWTQFCSAVTFIKTMDYSD